MKLGKNFTCILGEGYSGLEKKSGRPGQVVFGFGQVTFLASLPDRQGYG